VTFFGSELNLQMDLQSFIVHTKLDIHMKLINDMEKREFPYSLQN
jgi:hypothetical protein